MKNKKINLILGLVMILAVSFPLLTSAQFVEDPEVKPPANTPSIETNIKVNKLFDILIIISALVFIVSVIGFIIGFIKLVTSGGDEKTIETSNNILVLSGWIFIVSIVIYLLVNIVKFFIY